MSSSLTGSAEDNASGSGTDKWLDIDDNLSVPTQTLEEILAERSDLFDEELSIFDDDDSLLYPLGRPGTSSAAVAAASISYQLDNPLIIERADSISHQLGSMRDRPHGGLPTALAVCEPWVAVGTTRGLVAIFERDNERLLQFISPPKQSTNGSVSSLQFSPDCTRLAVGFNRGGLLIYGLTHKRALNDFEEVAQPGHGIIHLQYVTDNALVVLDSGGSVFELHERTSRRRSARCIFTGCKGEVVSAVSIPPAELLLLSSLKQVLVISVRRGVAVVQLRLGGPADSPPLMDWRHRLHQVTQRTTVKETKLCLARGKEIRIHQVQAPSARGVNFLCPLVKVIRLEEALINVKWMDDHHLLCLTRGEYLHLVDIHKGAVVATKDASHIQMVYGSADFKGLSTGGNVSAAMVCLADGGVCYQSVQRLSDQLLYIVGQAGVFRLRLMDQLAQMNALVARGDTASALLFASDVYAGRVRDRTAKANLLSSISKRVGSLIIRLLEETLEGLHSGSVAALCEHYKKNILVLQRACISTSHFDLLYNTVFRRLEADVLARQIFLELLEEYVVEGQLDQPPPALIRDYLSHLLVEGQLAQFEGSVTRLPIDCLDLHQVITACRQNQLFDALSYVLNRALGDYIGPLQEMCDNLRRFAHKEVLSDVEQEQGNRILLYLSCSLAGKAYPHGELPQHLLEVVPLETYKWLMHPHTDGGGDGEGFSNLRLLLRFDASQFLNAICACVDAPLLSGSGGSETHAVAASGRLKRLVDVLVGLATGNEAPALVPFLVTLLQKGAIQKDAHLFQQLIENVLRADFENARAQSSAERSVVELMGVVEEIDREAVLQAALPRPFVHICSFIYRQRGQHEELLRCCLRKDAAVEAEPTRIFDVINELLNDPSDLRQLKVHVQSLLPQLCSIDSKMAARLVLSHFPDYLSSSASSGVPFPLLRDCFAVQREERGAHWVSGDEELDESLFNALFEGNIAEGATDAHLAEELSWWLPLGSATDLCLNLAISNGLMECSVLLLEARGLVGRAFELLYEQMLSVKSDNGRAPLISRMFRLAEAHPEEAASGEWLLKLLLLLLNDLPSSNDNTHHLMEVFTALVVEGPTPAGGAKVRALEEVLSHPSMAHSPVSTFIKPMQRMLLTCQLERILNEGALGCIQREVVGAFKKRMGKGHTRWAHIGRREVGACIMCRQQVVDKSSVVFGCGHLAHLECSDGKRRCPCACDGGD